MFHRFLAEKNSRNGACTTTTIFPSSVPKFLLSGRVINHFPDTRTSVSPRFRIVSIIPFAKTPTSTLHYEFHNVSSFPAFRRAVFDLSLFFAALLASQERERNTGFISDFCSSNFTLKLIETFMVLLY